VVFSGSLRLGGLVGTVTIAAFASAATVTNSQVTPQSAVLLTLQTNPGFLAPSSIWVTTAAGSFTVHAARPVIAALTWAYVILNP